MPTVDPATILNAVELGTGLLDNIIGTISGLTAVYGASDPRVQGVTAQLYALLGAEAQSEIAQRVSLETAREIARREAAATRSPAAVPMPPEPPAAPAPVTAQPAAPPALPAPPISETGGG